MRTLILMMATAGLLAGAATNSWADSAADQSKTAAAQQTAKNYEFKGDVARARDDNASAAAWYGAATRYDKNNAALFNKLGIAQLKSGEMNAARKAFGDAVKRDPTFVDALNNLGAVNCLQRRYKPAVKYLKQALALDETQGRGAPESGRSLDGAETAGTRDDGVRAGAGAGCRHSEQRR